MSDSTADINRLTLLKRAYTAIEEQQARIRELEAQLAVAREPLAIVGLACRFPGADDPEAYWDLLRAGRDATSDVPSDRWDVEAFYDRDPDAVGRMYTRRGGFLRDVAGFDAAFFGISPREAIAMDPQHRLLLETTCDALDRAGQPRDRLAESPTGVFIGITASEYGQLEPTPAGLAAVDSYQITGNTLNAAAGRIAYTLGFRGPAIAVDTACSSSLVAVHLACSSIWRRECEQAIAGGVHLMLSPAGHVALSKARVLSPSGRCRTFDASADGMARGEGCGVIVIRRLSAALADGDPIVAVIRGSAVNQDGPSGGLTVPNGTAQTDVIVAALRSAGVAPGEVSYVEAHGTATPLGDPIEIAALGRALCSGRTSANPLWIGSAKTNLGHLEAAAGIAGLIKVALSLQCEEIPPHLHFTTPNPQIPWNEFPVRVTTERRSWPREVRPRRAGVSAFGFSGTNAHVVLEEAPAPAAAEQPETHRVTMMRVAARTEDALCTLAARYAAHIEAHPEQALIDIAYTANTGRADGPERAVVIAEGRAQVIAGLRQIAGGCGERAGSVAVDGFAVFRGRAVERRTDLTVDLSGGGDRVSRLEQAAAVYIAGGQPQWTMLEADCPRRRVVLPTYPWQRERYWRDQPRGMHAAHTADPCAGWTYAIDWVASDIAAASPAPEPMPQLPRIEEHVRPHLDAVRRDAMANTYADAFSALERAAMNGAAAALGRMGLDVRDVQRKDLDAIANRLGVRETRGPLLARILGALRDWSGADAESFETVATRFPTAAAEVRILQRCVDALPEVLRGEIDPLTLLFPADGGVSAAHLYSDALAARLMNGVMREVVAGVAKGSRARPLRVLEIGAGTGGTTDFILPVLHSRDGQPICQQYTFTDISPAFFARARERFADVPFLSMARLDIESSPRAQGFAAGEYDVVIAANVLHATRDLRRTLSHAMELLTPGGLLLVQEWTQPMLAIDLIFGLTDGWWRFEDRALRSSHPLLSVEGWRSVLAPFGDVTVFGSSSDDRGAMARQGVIVLRTYETPLEVQARAAAEIDRGRWLVLDARPERAAGVRAALESRGAHAEIVAAAPEAIAAALADGRSTLRGVVDLRAIDATSMTGTDAVADAARDVSTAVTELVQSISRAVPAGCELHLVTRTAISRAGVTPNGVTQAPVWGIGKVVTLEQPEIRTRLIDLDDATDVSAAIAAVIARAGNETQIAFSNGHAFVPRLTPYLPPRPDERFRIDSHGAYVISGGFGGLGLLLAEWLAAKGAGLVVPVGRRQSAATAETLRRIEQRGARLLPVCADVADAAQVDDLVSQVRARGMRVAGVFHAAGVLDDGIVLQLTPDRFARVMDPKVKGAWNLHVATAADRPDAFVLFSAATSLFGSAGQATHAAANAWLDTFAAWRRAQSLPAISINWGAWDSVGAASGSDVAARLRMKGLRPLLPQQGLEILERLLAADVPQVGAFGVDWERVPPAMASQPFMSACRGNEVGKSHSAGRSFREELDQTPQHRRRTLLAAHVRDQIRTTLAVSEATPIDMRQGLFELGVDSLTAMELRQRLQTSCGCALPATLVFDCPTPDAIVDRLIVSLASSSAPEPALETPTASALSPAPITADAKATASAEATSAPRLAGEVATVDEPIAIVGMACRFPGANGIDEYWRLLRNGVDAITEIPRSRWDIDACYDPNPDAAGRMYTRAGGFLDGFEEFDAGFFGMSPREAISLDPQQRLLLESCWQALEHAGISPDAVRDTQGGVFIGMGGVDYYQRLAARAPELVDAYMASGNAHSTAAGRLSYLLGLHGPSLAIDTACSSSLVAVHLACQSLRRGECTLALTGGVSVILSPSIHFNHCRSRMLAPDGRCKAFDASADGFIRSEGIGIVVLKRQSDAERDGDRILALIRGSAVNQDGRTSALTVPNGAAQQSVIRQALADARLDAGQISYVEAHGTGTSLGDPIEANALAAVFAGRPQPLPIGSVKTNIGHAEAAAGIAGLLKVVLAMQHHEIPPQLHFTTPNPRIEWDQIPVRVVTSRTPWGASGQSVFAGVSSFGFGGTNAHVVLESAVPRQLPERGLAPGHGLLVLSARTDAALRALALQYRDTISQSSDREALARALATAARGRAHMAVRGAIAADAPADVVERLSALAGNRVSTGCWLGEAKPDLAGRIAFIYPGQGALRAGMGRELYESNAVFRSAIDRCAAIVDDELRQPLREVLFGSAAETLLERTEYAQPAVFAIEYALTTLWASCGVRPDAVVGHSVGEFAAACAAGVLTLAEACALVLARGRLMQPIQGRMAAVAASEEAVRKLLAAHPDVDIGALNGRQQTVVTGAETAVGAVVDEATRAGMKAAMLPGKVAFHSREMERMLPSWRAVLERAPGAPPQCDWVSTLTGQEITEPTDWQAYWPQQARQPVAFAAAVKRLWTLGYRVFLEAGPTAGLSTLAAEAADTASGDGVWLAGLRAGRGEWDALRDRVAQLYVSGVDIDWRGWDAERRARVTLPTYPFQRTRYWVDAAAPEVAPRPEAPPVYAVEWQPLDRTAAEAPVFGTWIVCGASPSVVEQAANALRSRGVNVAPAPDTGAMLEIIAVAADRGVAGVLHLDAPSAFADPAPADAIERDVIARCETVLSTARALMKRRTAAGLWLVTRGAAVVPGAARRVMPNAAALWGLGRVIALEQPELWGGLIDLDPDVPGVEGLARVLDCGEENQLAVRGDRIYVPRLEATRAQASRVSLRADRNYLITGGLGALGLAVAQHWIANGVRHLTLLARRAPGADVQQRIAAWRNSGVTVTVAQADVCDRAAMSGVLQRIAASGAPLGGIVHAAGTNGYQPVADLDVSQLQPVLAAKVSGAWVLHELTRDLPLDFFNVFSSIASVWGSKGQAHYAAANAFLDALVAHRLQHGLPGLSISWGSWAAGGMATDDAQAWLRRVGVNALRPDLALDAFAAILGTSGHHVIAAIDWPRFLEVYEARRRHPFFERFARVVPTQKDVDAAGPDPDELSVSLRRQGPHDGRRALLAFVRDQVTQVLGLDAADAPAPHQGFFSIGFDSLMALELKNRLAAALHAPLPSTLAFDYPSIRELTEYLASQVLRLDLSVTAVAAAAEPAARPGDVDASVAAALARFDRVVVKS